MRRTFFTTTTALPLSRGYYTITLEHSNSSIIIKNTKCGNGGGKPAVCFKDRGVPKWIFLEKSDWKNLLHISSVLFYHYEILVTFVPHTIVFQKEVIQNQLSESVFLTHLMLNKTTNSRACFFRFTMKS